MENFFPLESDWQFKAQSSMKTWIFSSTLCSLRTLHSHPGCFLSLVVPRHLNAYTYFLSFCFILSVIVCLTLLCFIDAFLRAEFPIHAYENSIYKLFVLGSIQMTINFQLVSLILEFISGKAAFLFVVMTNFSINWIVTARCWNLRYFRHDWCKHGKHIIGSVGLEFLM